MKGGRLHLCDVLEMEKVLAIQSGSETWLAKSREPKPLSSLAQKEVDSLLCFPAVTTGLIMVYVTEVINEMSCSQWQRWGFLPSLLSSHHPL